MVAGSITEEMAMAVLAEMIWKAAFATASANESFMRNLLTGLGDVVVKIDGDGGPGSRYTLKYNPGVGAAPVVVKSRLAARDDAARVITWDEVAVEGGEVATRQLKSQVVQYKVEPAGTDGCVTKVTVEYESLHGTPLSPADEVKLIKGYVCLMKTVGENMIARPHEFA